MKRTLLRAVCGVLCSASLVAAAEPRRFYVANDDHTDFMWTADADTYGAAFCDMLDFHLKLADETAGNPPEFRNRFNCDGSYWVWNYERRKTPAEFERLMARVKDGTISVPLNTLASCYGGQPVEGVLRGLYYAGRLERRYGVRLPLVAAMENQTLPLGLASLFAGAGAEYSWRGVCGCASKLPNKGGLMQRDREIYWYTGHDGQRVLMKWYSLGAGNIGGYWEAGNPSSSIKTVEGNADFWKRYADPATGKPYSVVGLFGFGGDDLARKTGTTPPPPIPAVPGLQAVVSSPYVDHFHLQAQKLTTPERQVVVSNEADFFKDFEARYGKTLPSDTVTYGNEWDLYSASMVETSARVKRAVEKLRSAELLATLVSLKYPDFMKRHAAARDEAFTGLGLYWEHDWTADGPVSRGQRAAWEELQAQTIDYYVNGVYAEAIIRLGGMIPQPAKAERYFVLNPLGWTRTDYADFPYGGPAAVHVRDVTTGKDVPAQVVKLSGARRLRVLAADVPSAGYKVFEVLPGPGTAATDAAATVGVDGVFENSAVKLAVDRDGAIRSFVDKRSGNTEFAREIEGLKINDLVPNSDDGDALTVENAGPVSVTLRARSAAGLAHTTAITLYRDSDRVDIRNEITENFSKPRYWSFGFGLDAPAVHTEEVGSINLDKLKSDGGDYAVRNARYDHVTLNHFADLTDGKGAKGVTLSNPDLAFAKLGASTVKSLDTTTPQVNVLAGGQVDGSWLGIRDQNDATYFLQRFALHAHAAYDPVAAMKFALEHQNPLVCGPVISKEGGVYPADTYSLLTLADANVLLWAVKPAEEGIDHGVVVRLWNLADAAARTVVTADPAATSATQTTHVETDIDPAGLTPQGGLAVDLSPQQLKTYRLMLPLSAKVKP